MSAASKNRKRKLVTYKYETPSDMTNTVLEVEGYSLHVNKDLLMVASPVFKAMFTASFKESKSLKVELKGKKAEHVVWMLDYLYPETPFDITDEKAVKLLPLAEEYQLDRLKHLCVEILKKQTNPKLEIITVAQRFNLTELLTLAINRYAESTPCTTHTDTDTDTDTDIHGFVRPTLSSVKPLRPYMSTCQSRTMDEELSKPENADLGKKSLSRIYRKKLALARERSCKVEQCLKDYENAGPTYNMSVSTSKTNAMKDLSEAIKLHKNIY